MPSAIVTKAASKGTKRKESPEKEAFVKKSKKIKTDKVEKGDKPVQEKKVKQAVREEEEKKDKKKKVKSTKKREKLSDDDSESDGGAPLEDQDVDPEEEDIPTAEDGLHPDRAKGVALSSKTSLNVAISDTNL
jgi:hypothetical protein